MIIRRKFTRRATEGLGNHPIDPNGESGIKNSHGIQPVVELEVHNTGPAEADSTQIMETDGKHLASSSSIGDKEKNRSVQTSKPFVKLGVHNTSVRL